MSQAGFAHDSEGPRLSIDSCRWYIKRVESLRKRRKEISETLDALTKVVDGIERLEKLEKEAK